MLTMTIQSGPKPTPQVTAAGLELEDEGTCTMCGGTGGWPGPNGKVECKPCGGAGLAEDSLAPKGPAD